MLCFFHNHSNPAPQAAFAEKLLKIETVQREVSILKDSTALLFFPVPLLSFPLSSSRLITEVLTQTERDFRLGCHLHAEMFPAFTEPLKPASFHGHTAERLQLELSAVLTASLLLYTLIALQYWQNNNICTIHGKSGPNSLLHVNETGCENSSACDVLRNSFLDLIRGHTLS